MGHLRSGLRFGVLGEFVSCPKFFSVSKRWHESSEKKAMRHCVSDWTWVSPLRSPSLHQAHRKKAGGSWAVLIFAVEFAFASPSISTLP